MDVNSEQVQLISTGGTIDKYYDPVSGHLLVGPSVLPRVLQLSGLTEAACEVLEVLRKDSLEILDSERSALAGVVAASSAKRFLITHGTDTMGASAALIEREALGKTVVLTGAMVPYSIQGSDAAFNLGVAFSAAQLLPPGVYIAMHGKVLPHARYRKDRAAGRFQESPPAQ